MGLLSYQMNATLLLYPLVVDRSVLRRGTGFALITIFIYCTSIVSHVKNLSSTHSGLATAIFFKKAHGTLTCLTRCVRWGWTHSDWSRGNGTWAPVNDEPGVKLIIFDPTECLPTYAYLYCRLYPHDVPVSVSLHNRLCPPQNLKGV